MISLMISIMINSFNCIIRRFTRGMVISYVNNFTVSNKIIYNYAIILANQYILQHTELNCYILYVRKSRNLAKSNCLINNACLSTVFGRSASFFYPNTVTELKRRRFIKGSRFDPNPLIQLFDIMHRHRLGVVGISNSSVFVDTD